MILFPHQVAKCKKNTEGKTFYNPILYKNKYICIYMYMLRKSPEGWIKKSCQWSFCGGFEGKDFTFYFIHFCFV